MAWSQSNDDRLARAAGQETGSTSDQKWIATPNYARQIEAISRAARELDLDLGLGLDVGPMNWNHSKHASSTSCPTEPDLSE